MTVEDAIDAGQNAENISEQASVSATEQLQEPAQENITTTEQTTEGEQSCGENTGRQQQK